MIGKNWLKHTIAIMCMAVGVGLFFAHLWYPNQQLFINPEYGASDITHFNLAVRQAYWEDIQEGRMPLWNSRMGGGFPLYAESQVGAWFIPNVLLYSSLSIVNAFNASHVVAWLLGMVGMYAWVYYRTKRMDVAVVLGWAFVFSGYFVGHLQHVNMLQTASVVPWICLAIALAGRTRWWMWGIASILVSQQIFAGHLQTTFLTGCLVLLLELVDWFALKRSVRVVMLRMSGIVVLFTVSMAVLSAVQVYPSWELHSLSVRSESFSAREVMHFSVHPRMLATFALPFSMGSVQDGTFAFLKTLGDTGAIFWESWLYMGWIVALALIGSLGVLQKSRQVQGLWVGLLISVGFMTARYSPLYFVYSIPPFNYFTTPARWWLVGMVFVVLLSSYVLKRIPRWGVLVVGLALVVDGVFVWHRYGVLVPASDVLNPPQTAQIITTDERVPDSDKKALSIQQGEWHNEFVSQGWKRPDRFVFMYNALGSNMNMLWGITSQHEYVGRIWTRRKNAWDSIVSGVERDNPDDPVYQAGLQASRLSSVDYLVSSQPRKASPLGIATHSASLSYFVYPNTDAKPRVWMTDSVTPVSTVEDVVNELASKDYDGDVFSETDLGIERSTRKQQMQASILTDDHQKLVVSTTSDVTSLLVVTDTFYPGWVATIDGEAATINPINIAQRGVVVPKGTHTVTFQFKPQSYARGARVSFIGHLIVLGVVVLAFVKARLSSSARSKLHAGS